MRQRYFLSERMKGGNMARYGRSSNLAPQTAANIEKLCEFQSWGEFIEYSTKMPTVKFQGSRLSRNGYSFSHTHSFEEAVKLATEGWPDAEAKARKLSSVMFDKISSLIERETVAYDVEGVDFDMGLYMSGEPECWMRFDKHLEEDEGNRIVRIVVDVAASCRIDASVIVARGAAIGALIELLEYGGTRCEVIAHSGQEAVFHTRTIVKTADQPLDLGRLMFAIGHPAMLRRLIFGALEQNPTEHAKLGMGYGHPVDAPKELQGDIYLGSMSYGEVSWENTESAQQWVISQLRNQGIEVKEK